MTRETKIGLLVGLAFIIVIGILLSDHMTSTTQPPQAMLVDSASNVRESVTTPAPAQPGPAPLGRIPQITPANPVPTQSELRPRPPVVPGVGVTQVEVGGPANPAGVPIAIRSTGSPVVPAQPENVQPPVAAGNGPVQPSGGATTELEQWAHQVGEPLVPAGATPAVAKPATAAKQEYVAQAGDNLSKVAAKTLGSSSKANIAAIIKANPSLEKNPDLIVEGRKYVIPTAATVPTTPVTVVQAPQAVPVTEVVDPLPVSSPADGGGSWYVVKDNDNLWKIASDQLGSGNAWLQIKDMNKDILKGGDTVQPNMRLRLPPKPLASAN